MTKTEAAHLLIVLAVILISAYGAMLSFSASIILGVVVLMVQPAPLILGLMGILGNTKAPYIIAAKLHLPF
jgi:hypothetical protein